MKVILGPWTGTSRTMHTDRLDGEPLHLWTRRKFGPGAFMQGNVNFGRDRGIRINVIGYLVDGDNIWAVQA